MRPDKDRRKKQQKRKREELARQRAEEQTATIPPARAATARPHAGERIDFSRDIAPDIRPPAQAAPARTFTAAPASEASRSQERLSGRTAVAPRSPTGVRSDEPELQTRGTPLPSVLPALGSVVACGVCALLTLMLWRRGQEFLATAYVLGMQPWPFVLAAALLYLPTPVASLRAGRSAARVALEGFALALGIVSTGFLIVAAGLRDRDDAAYMLLVTLFVLAPFIRVLAAPRLHRMWIRARLRVSPRGAQMLELNESFTGRTLPPGLPAPLTRSASRLTAPLRWMLRAAGSLHRALHGAPTLPSQLMLTEARTSLQLACDAVRAAARRSDAVGLANAARRELDALAFYLELHALHRLQDRRAWPQGVDRPPVSTEDVLLADVEVAYVLLLQACLHPAGGDEIRDMREAALDALHWTLETLGVRSDPAHGAIGYLFHASGTSADDDGLELIRGIAVFESQLDDDAASSGRAEDVAASIVAQRLWEQGFHCWALQLLDGVERSAREQPLARYVRSRIHASLQEHHETMDPADRLQLQALAADDAVWADAPELYRKELQA